MIERNLRLSRAMYRALAEVPELEAASQSLSIATFRYVPGDLDPGDAAVAAYLDALNTALVTRLQKNGEIFISNAVVGPRFLLRACITNFRTSPADTAPQSTVRLAQRGYGARGSVRSRPPSHGLGHQGRLLGRERDLREDGDQRVHGRRRVDQVPKERARGVEAAGAAQSTPRWLGLIVPPAAKKAST